MTKSTKRGLYFTSWGDGTVTVEDYNPVTMTIDIDDDDVYGPFASWEEMEAFVQQKYDLPLISYGCEHNDHGHRIGYGDHDPSDGFNWVQETGERGMLEAAFREGLSYWEACDNWIDFIQAEYGETCTVDKMMDYLADTYIDIIDDLIEEMDLTVPGRQIIYSIDLYFGPGRGVDGVKRNEIIERSVLAVTGDNIAKLLAKKYNKKGGKND